MTADWRLAIFDDEKWWLFPLLEKEGKASCPHFSCFIAQGNPSFIAVDLVELYTLETVIRLR